MISNRIARAVVEPPQRNIKTKFTKHQAYVLNSCARTLFFPECVLKNSQPRGEKGVLERLGWFPKFYPVLSSEVSLPLRVHDGTLGVINFSLIIILDLRYKVVDLQGC